MAEEKIAVHFVRIEHVVMARVMAFPESVRETLNIESAGDDNFLVASASGPALGREVLYLRGKEVMKDHKLMLYEYDCTKSAMEAIRAFTGLIEQWNKTQTTKSYLEGIKIEETLAGA